MPEQMMEKLARAVLIAMHGDQGYWLSEEWEKAEAIVRAMLQELRNPGGGFEVSRDVQWHIDHILSQ